MLLKTSWLVVFSTIVLFLFSGCFEILEEVTIHENGSGNATVTLNISQSKTRLASIMLMDSINGYNVPTEAEIRRHIQELAQMIKKTKGVSNVSTVINFDDYIFSLSCDFATVNVLNKVLSSISSKQDAAMMAKKKPFSFDKSRKTFSRNYHYNIASEFKKIKKDDQEILKGASVTTIYRFDKPVVSTKNKACKVAKSKKAVFLRVSAEDLIKGRKNIKNQIQLGK